MQDAGVDVTEHAVLQVMAIEQRAERLDEVRQVFRRNRGVFDKGLGLASPLTLPNKPTARLRIA